MIIQISSLGTEKNLTYLPYADINSATYLKGTACIHSIIIEVFVILYLTLYFR